MMAAMRPAVRVAIFELAKLHGLAPQEFAGQVLESYVVDSFEDSFAGISFQDFSRLLRKGARVRLRDFAAIAQPDEKAGL